MSARNDASIRLTLQADQAISKAQQLKTGMQQIGTGATGAGAKTSAATKQMGAGLTAVSSTAKITGTAFMNVGTQGTVMGQKVNASTKIMTAGTVNATASARTLGTAYMNVGTQATMMGQKTTAATGAMAAGTAKAGGAAVAGGGSMMMMGAATAGLSASVVQLQTSFSSLTAYEIKHDKAQLKVKKNMDTLNATKIMATQYNARLEDMVQKGITSGTQFNYVQAMSIQYNTMLETKTEDLVLVKRKAVLASEELSDANANFWSGVITSSINIAIMSSLLITNLFAMKANGIGALGLAGKMSILTGAVRVFGGALTTILKHPVFLIATAAFLAWELALSGVVEKMLGLEDGSLSVTKNIMSMFESMGSGVETTVDLTQETDGLIEKQVELALALDDTTVAATGAAVGLGQLDDTVTTDIRNQKEFARTIEASTRALDRFKKKRLINPQALGARYTGIAAGSMSAYGNLYQQGAAMGNRYYSGGSGGWTAQNQANKEGRMAANMAASQSRNRRRLDARDNLMNALRGAGLKGQLGRDGTFTMGLSDGSQIRTIRGHLTGKYRKNDKAKGFAGGDELQGSFMQGGRDAWSKYQAGVSGVLKRNARPNSGKYGGWGKYGSLQKTLQRERIKYHEELQALVKAMIIRQLKDKQSNDAEIERLSNLDGSKAKEYYNKVGTHEAYDVYDRQNYKAYKTNMEGGATANI